jgi:flagellar motor switch/type III secretory pathway protein FliN
MEEKPRPTSELPQLSSALQERWAAAALLPCSLSVELAVPEVTIGDLLDLEVGSVINSHHCQGNPLPVWVNGVIVGWAEFDVVGKHLAVRITEVC